MGKDTYRRPYRTWGDNLVLRLPYADPRIMKPYQEAYERGHRLPLRLGEVVAKVNVNDMHLRAGAGRNMELGVHTIIVHRPGEPALQLLEEAYLERLAELEHVQWARWTEYMLDTLVTYAPELATHPHVLGWRRQIATPYADLTERERDSDREWAHKVLTVLREVD